MLTLLALIVGGALGAGTYAAAKKRNATNGQSAAAAAVSGATGLALVLWAWPLLLIGGAVAGGYYFGKRRHQKALPPAS